MTIPLFHHYSVEPGKYQWIKIGEYNNEGIKGDFTI
jgi:hypothetical protein